MQSSNPSKPTHWALQWLILGGVLLLGFSLIFGPLLIGKAHSQGMLTPHEHFHDDFYQKWEQSNGHSCCNSKSRHANGDCAPLDSARLRTRGEDVQVLIETEWITVSPEKIRPYFAPDFSHHLCNQGKNVLCLVVGGGT